LLKKHISDRQVKRLVAENERLTEKEEEWKAKEKELESRIRVLERQLSDVESRVNNINSSILFSKDHLIKSSHFVIIKYIYVTRFVVELDVNC
jgi:chromosome segregation ATPase